MWHPFFHPTVHTTHKSSLGRLRAQPTVHRPYTLRNDWAPNRSFSPAACAAPRSDNGHSPFPRPLPPRACRTVPSHPPAVQHARLPAARHGERPEPSSSRRATLITLQHLLLTPTAQLPPRPKPSRPVPRGEARARPWLCLAGRAQGSHPRPAVLAAGPLSTLTCDDFLCLGCHRHMCCARPADELGAARPVIAGQSDTGGRWAASTTTQRGGACQRRLAGTWMRREERSGMASGEGND